MYISSNIDAHRLFMVDVVLVVVIPIYIGRKIPTIFLIF